VEIARMLTAIHGNTGFPGVKSLVIHGRASSMVERYSMAGEVSQHHVPLQCGDPVEMTRLRLYTGIHRETVFQVSGSLVVCSKAYSIGGKVFR